MPTFSFLTRLHPFGPFSFFSQSKLITPSQEATALVHTTILMLFILTCDWFNCLHLSVDWVKVAPSCLTLCNPMDYTVHGILQARILEWVAVPFSRGSSQPRDWPRYPTLQAYSLPAEPPEKPIVCQVKIKQHFHHWCFDQMSSSFTWTWKS